MIRLEIRVVPNARRNAIDGRHGDAIKIRLNAPAVDGKANAALITFLADTLELKKSAITILRGEKSRSKVVQIDGITANKLHDRIGSPVK